MFSQSIIDLLERPERPLEFTGAGVKNEDKISSLNPPQFMPTIIIPAELKVSFGVPSAIHCK